MDKLEKIGLKWVSPTSVTWDTMYDALCRYAQAKRDEDENGCWDGTISSKYKTDGDPALNLESWTLRQRTAYKIKELEKDRFDKLEKIGFKWDASLVALSDL